jgi:DNA-binding response OmpR family regulator
VIVIRATYRDTADALADVFQSPGYATVWQRPGRATCVVRGATAGIWDGGQLDECEADALGSFCRMLRCDAAPVMALLDFPRRDSVDRALQIGATSVFGKPWKNADLVAAIKTISQNVALTRVA